MKIARLVSQQAGAPTADPNANNSPQSIAPTLRLRLPLDLPSELRMAVLGCLVPATPFLSREDEPVRRFPVAAAIRNLRAVSETCTELNALVDKLRRLPEFAATFELACRYEYEFKKRKDESARQTCIRRYNIDPLISTAPPGHLQDVCKHLRNLDDVQETTTLLLALKDYGRLQEFAFGGALLQAAILQPWDLLAGASSLQSLVIDGCKLDETQIVALAKALEGSSLRELHIAGEIFTKPGTRALALAIRDSKSLLGLTLENCEISSR